MEITGGVRCSIVKYIEYRARQLPNIERKRVEYMSSVEIVFGIRIQFVNFEEFPAIPFRFIFESRDELRPANISDSLSERVIFDHVLDCRGLDADRLVFTDQASREFVQEITASIGYSGMDACHFLGGFGSIFRSLLFLRVPTLSLGKLLFVLREEFGITNGLPGREDHEVFQSQISPYGLFYRIKLLDSILYQYGDEVAISGVFGDGDGARFAVFRQGSRPHDSKGFSHLCDGECAIVPLKSRCGVLSALLIALFLECGILGIALEEVPERLIQMAQGLLSGNTGNIVEPCAIILLFQLGEHGRGIAIIQAALLFVVCIRTQAQSPIIHETSTAKRLSKNLSLLIGRVKSVRICSFLFHASHHSRYGVKSQQERRKARKCALWRVAIPPLSKDAGFPCHFSMTTLLLNADIEKNTVYYQAVRKKQIPDGR